MGARDEDSPRNEQPGTRLRCPDTTSGRRRLLIRNTVNLCNAQDIKRRYIGNAEPFHQGQGSTRSQMYPGVMLVYMLSGGGLGYQLRRSGRRPLEAMMNGHILGVLGLQKENGAIQITWSAQHPCG